MKQTTLLGNLTVDMGTSDNLLLSNVRSSLTPNVSMDVEHVYQETEKTVEQIKKLMPHITHELITTEERMNEYLQNILKQGTFSIDTEVDGLNPRLDKIAGISVWTKGENPAYIPINHHFYEHNLNAVSFVKMLAREIKRGKLKAIMHNSKYDMRVLYTYSGVWVRCHFDTLVAGHLLDENSEHGLKYLWNVFCMGGRYDAKTYGDLFERRKYSSFIPEKVYVYASLDAVMTYQLYQYQLPLLTRGTELNRKYGLGDVADLFWDIEMKVIHIATEMEERGTYIDKELNTQLHRKYEKLIREETNKVTPLVDALVTKYYTRLTAEQISKLDTPVNLTSDTQLKIIFYHLLEFELSEALTKKVRVKKRKNKNYDPNAPIESVDKDAIKYFRKIYPEYDELLAGIAKISALKTIYNTFIVGIRGQIDPLSDKVHGGWNPNGTKTGRFSSSKPNL